MSMEMSFMMVVVDGKTVVTRDLVANRNTTSKSKVGLVGGVTSEISWIVVGEAMSDGVGRTCPCGYSYPHQY